MDTRVPDDDLPQASTAVPEHDLPEGFSVNRPGDSPSKAPDPAIAHRMYVQDMVDKMSWPERQVTAFGESASHAIHQGANLLGKIGVPGAPTDEDLKEESANLAPLRDAAPVASGLGSASLAVPAAVGVSAALPATGVASVIGNGVAGAAVGGAFSDPDHRAHNAAVGGALSAGLPLAASGLGKGLGAIGDASARKAGEAVGEAAQKVNAAESGALASETGKLGGLTQDLNRKIEWIIRLSNEEKSGVISPENLAALDAFKKSPDYARLVNTATEKVLDAAPGAVGRVANQGAAVEGMADQLPSTVAGKTADAVSGKEALSQMMARVKRYGLPVVGGAVGHALLPGLGTGGGALAGAALRPMMHSLLRLSANPAVRNQLFSAVEDAARAGEGALTSAATPATAAAARPAAADVADWLRLRVGQAAADPDTHQPEAPGKR